jgi:glycerol kinase
VPVCESGGISLEWFQNNLAEMLTYQELDKRVADKKRPGDLVFLPYLTGTNSPDFNADAKGVLYGLKLVHDRIDCALAVMEGVAYLLHRNLASLERMGVRAERWIHDRRDQDRISVQIKADQTGYVLRSHQTEPPRLAVPDRSLRFRGVYGDYTGHRRSLAWKKTFTPAIRHLNSVEPLVRTLYQQLGPVVALDPPGE